MSHLNRLRPKPSHLIAHQGQALLITDLDGFIGADIEGFYYRKTRFLSRLRLTTDGRAPLAVAAHPVDCHSLIAYYLAPSPAGSKAGPQPGTGDSGGEVVEHGIEFHVNGFVGSGLRYDIYVTNRTLAAATIELCWHLDADFADRIEAEQGKRQQNADVARDWRETEHGGTLALRYRHSQLDHATEICFSGGDFTHRGPGVLTTVLGSIPLSGTGDFVHREDAVICKLQLSPQQPVALSVEVMPVFCGEHIKPQPRRDNFLRSSSGGASGSALEVIAGNRQVQRAWDRAVSDLDLLALHEGTGDERRAPAGGIPKYIGLFGRDVLITAFQAGLHSAETLRGALSLVAQWQGTKYDDRFDEEPGRIIHQRQLGPLELLEKNPFLHYYGDYSAPGLFLIDLAWHLALTGDKEFFLSLKDKALTTLEWMDRDSDRDHDGFYEYDTKAGSWGEKNQGWKDSNEAILYEDGRIVENPIALVEIQGCYYAAKQLMGLAFALIGDDQRAAALLAQAERLKQRFNKTFWMPDLEFFGLALDPAKQLVRTIAADPGQCLSYGIIDDEKAEAVAARLMAPDLFTGWGIRTLSSHHPVYNPFAYHLGSVWPSANAIIGFGFKRYGLNQKLHRLAQGLFDATELFDFDRLPEAIGGHARDREHPHPGIYPDACSPQAWSAGAVVLLVISMLGLLPAAPRQTLIVDPDLPEWLPELTLRNIQVGNAQVSLRFRRDGAGYTDHEVIETQGELRIHRPRGDDNAAGDRFARYLQEVLSR